MSKNNSILLVTFFLNRLLGGIPSIKERAPPASQVYMNKLLQISVLDLFVLNFHPVVNLFHLLSDSELLSRSSRKRKFKPLAYYRQMDEENTQCHRDYVQALQYVNTHITWLDSRKTTKLSLHMKQTFSHFRSTKTYIMVKNLITIRFPFLQLPVLSGL